MVEVTDEEKLAEILDMGGLDDLKDVFVVRELDLEGPLLSELAGGGMSAAAGFTENDPRG